LGDAAKQVNHPGAVLQRGGRILCVQASAAATNCDSCAFANKLIAMVVPDAIYEKYLQVRKKSSVWG
jgi:hypothetical protein